MSTFIKAEKVIATALGLLEREITLPGLVWRDAAGDFKGAKNDTISLRLPSYAVANKRDLRSGTARTQTALAENKVDVSLDSDIYLDIPISDEELSLDIADFGAQVLNPATQAIARKLEDEIAAVLTSPKGANGQALVYQNSVTHTAATDDPYDTAVDVRELLNNARVPKGGRVIVTGTDLESAFLKSDRFVKANESGSDSTLREATIGRVAGFDVVACDALAPDEAYAFHRTAYVLSSRAPVVPAGAPWGALGTYNGFAVRTVRVFDATEVEDRLVLDAWCGVQAVTDAGKITAGKFVPAAGQVTTFDDGVIADTVDAHRLVRAVKITVA